ncbi:hypothetical protein VC83_08585 [Pseudogymnoascus destructans]|uniref:RlpA-like protein double-psi beta-barrel domain-containing protein n=2 Tax=Pseudogymnoascus destructans TaxID=655981 RepID=L8FXV9_PSED2|nr:uncharacterized protein VC83_08585 [Pseudogymnoascus destructans]ELR05667.1 hypothetical protein GMDG_07510 [Pseudogymnoascus destructans 20631-21]OAF54921.1 hypothetical protein VC83_08585 [Pseudogymnoascus destructans]
MQYSFVAAGALLLATVAAQPHGHYNRHARRAPAVVTNVVDVYETVMLTATVWVDEQGNTISAPVTGTDASTVTGSPRTTVKPGEFNEPTKTQAPAPVVPTPSPSSEAVAAAPSAPKTTTIQVASVTPPAPVAPVIPTSVAAPVVNTPAAVAAPAAPAAVNNPVAPPAVVSTGGSSNGECSSGSPCSGDITFYEAGLGACGETTNGSTDKVVALPHEFMGTQSNGNPFCGKTVTINHKGATVQAKVVDKCMGCVGRDLDLSNAAFDGLGIAQSVGRTTADWYFN